MILTCPNCASRYVVDDAHVGPTGRMVRCAHCKTAWRAEPTGEALDLARAGDIKELTQAARPADLPGEALPKQYRARVQAREQAKAAAAAGVVWGGMAAVLGLLLVLAVVFRTQVAQVWPDTASAYAAVGLPVNVVGLVFESKSTLRVELDGRPAVRVTGAVRNVTRDPVRPPPLRVDLVDKADAALVSRTLDLGGTALAPGRARPFTVTFFDPPESADGAAMTFLIGRDAPARIAPAQAGGAPPHG
jgi:predicted Zn finger-like uncharacterized protein